MNDHDLHYLLLVGQHHSNRIMTRRTRRLELMPGQPKILEFLYENDGCTQKEIGKGCLLDKSTVTSLLSRMEACGLITKETDGSDRRSVCIRLTEKGISLAKKVRRFGSETDQLGWKDITEPEKKAFIATFQKIIRNLDEWEDMP